MSSSSIRASAVAGLSTAQSMFSDAAKQIQSAATPASNRSLHAPPPGGAAAAPPRPDAAAAPPAMAWRAHPPSNHPLFRGIIGMQQALHLYRANLAVVHTVNETQGHLVDETL